MTAVGVATIAAVSPSGIRASALSDIGLARENNEDAYAVCPELDLYVVSDGIGGRPGGETASQIVVQALPDLLRDRLAVPYLPEPARRAILRTSLLELSSTMRREASRWAGRAGMGATVVLASVHGDRVTVAHMGDSRAYRFRDGRLSALTQDHSVVGILLRQGEITEEEAASHPARGQITRYIGMGGEVDPDLATVGLESGDRLLLCSDGLTGVVSEETMVATLSETEGDPEAACRCLVAAALGAGAPDNVTALVADRAPVDAPGPSPRGTTR